MWRRLLAIASVLVVAFCLIHPPDTSPSQSIIDLINAIKKGSQKSSNGVSKESRLPTKEDVQKIFKEISRNSVVPDRKIPEHIRKKRQSYLGLLFWNNLGRGRLRLFAIENSGWQNILYPFGSWAMDEQLLGQAGRETQTNLGFDCPFFGFRFNYTFVYPMGMVSFAMPSFATPPWTFPNPSWPKQRDHSFIAPFYADAMYQWIGNTKVSNTFFRSVHRPRLDDDEVYNSNNPNYFGTGQNTVNQQQQYYGQQQQQQYGQTLNTNPLLGQQFGQSSIYSQQNVYQPQQYRKKRQMPGRISQPGM
ncbi:hypothetical protein COOONC_18194, partial [Cooperia oncophora]